MKPYPRIKRGAECSPIIWVLLVVSGLGAGPAGCGAYRKSDNVKEQDIQAVVMEVMQDQANPASEEYSLKGLTEYEDDLLNNAGQRGELKARTMHRLADLYLKFEDQTYHQQLDRYNQQLAQIRYGRNAPPPKPPVADHVRSKRIYEKLLVLYPDRPENDRVLYQLAHIYDDDGRTERAMSSLQKLVSRYPASPLQPESAFRLGEAYYDSNDFRKAQAAYQQAVQAKDPVIAGRALYKLGWTYISLQEYEKSVGVFVRLVDQKRVVKTDGQPQLDPTALSAAEWDEVLENIRGMATAFSYLGPPNAIQDYFARSGHRDYEGRVYRKLGDLYMAQKRPRDGIGAYEAFIQAYPLHEDAPVVQMEIINAYQKMNLVDLSNRARVNFVDRFGEDSLWYRKASVVGREKVRPLYRRSVSQLALFYHSEAQQSRRPQDYEQAFTWYRRYLKAFPKEPDAPRMNFLLAEGLYERRRYAEAEAEYENTAYNYFLHHDSAEAGYAAITTLDKIMAQQGKEAKDDPLAERMARNCKRFAESFPNDPRATDVLWKGAETYYRMGNLPASRAMAEEIVKSALPRTETSRKAQRLIARSYFEEGAYDQAASAYRRLVRTGGKTAEDAELTRLWASSLYKQAEALRNAGKLREAQTAFMRVQAEVPGSDAAPVALYDAAGVALLRNHTDEALQLFQIYLQRYPGHPLNKKVPETLLQVERNFLASGKVQEAQAFSEKVKMIQVPSEEDLAYRSERLLADRYFEQRDYEKAASAYRALALDNASARNREREELKRLWASARYKQAEGLKAAGKLPEAQAAYMIVQAEVPGSEVGELALYDAGGIALSRGDQEGALKAYTSLLEAYPTSTYGPHAAIQVGKIREQQGRLREAAENYESVVKLGQDRKTNGEMLLAAGGLYERLGNWDKAAEDYRLYLDQYPGEYQQVVETTYKLGWAELQQGRSREAQPIFQSIIDRYGQADAASTPVGYYVAKAHLLRGDDLALRFDEVRLVAPLDKNLARKKELLKDVLDQYAQAADYRVAEVTTAATEKIGGVFEKFRKALLDSERPPDLTPPQLEQYDFLLEEQAYPFEEKAIAAYESNVHRAQQLGLYDSWIRQSYDNLARLVPARYRKPELAEVIHPELDPTP
jgi:TolA-binding protein